MEQYYDETYEIRHADMETPHVVILGAGASRQAFPNGDRNGRKLPLMQDLVDTVHLWPLLKQSRIEAAGRNFEEIYSELCLDPKNKPLLGQIERQIFDYFSSLELPDHPTLYDHLVLSLGAKDLIATFNWDPLLFRCIHRLLRAIPKPKVVFLHGNVAVGYCLNHAGSTVGLFPGRCSRCGEEFLKSPLMFPVKEKGYASHPFIKLGWDVLRAYMKRAYVLTIFGYSAPSADGEAVALMKEGWGRASTRQLEEVEFIDRKEEHVLLDTWCEFVHSHHYCVTGNFYESLAASHPRRSCEALRARLMEHQYFEPRHIVWSAEFDDLYKSLSPRLGAEPTSGP